MMWKLTEHKDRRGILTHLTIDLDDIQIADVFPGAGKYKVSSGWVIEQAQLIVDTMNAADKEAS